MQDNNYNLLWDLKNKKLPNFEDLNKNLIENADNYLSCKEKTKQAFHILDSDIDTNIIATKHEFE